MAEQNKASKRKKAKVIPLAERPSQRQALSLTVAATLVSLPLMPHQPPAVSAICAVLLIWHGLCTLRQSPHPPRMLLMLVAIVGTVVIGFTMGRVFGKLPGLAMLSLFLPLKLLETRSIRDARAALMLSCFLLMGIFLHEQSMLTAVLALLGLVAVLVSFALLQHDAPLQWRRLQGSGPLLSQGVPLLILLFVFFPRIDGPLWGLPLDAGSGLTGLSDRMSPGSISDLIQSGEIAFRAEFSGALPPPAQRYWRGPVLSRFDGKEWRNIAMPPVQSGIYQVDGKAYDYSITLEPHNQRWLLSLDYPALDPERGAVLQDYTLSSRLPVRARQRYTLRSYPATPLAQQSAAYILSANTRLPTGSNPRSVALGTRIRDEAPNDAQRLARILAFMRQAGLRYTLSPPILGAHTADEFLFDTREGFCEHFSSSFVIIARAAGIPARVVTGYQGGEINTVDGSIVVRQSDAHAWAEVWLADKGWTRVDPTAASHPVRIEGSINDALSDTSALPFLVRSNLEWLRAMRHRWEALNNGWNQWVLGYNARRQLELMQQLGLPKPDWRTLAGITFAIGMGWLGWVVWRGKRGQPQRDALDKLWLGLCAKLGRRGFARHSWETAGDYALRVAKAEPALANFRQIAERYAQLRFGPQAATDTEIAALRQAAQEIFSK